MQNPTQCDHALSIIVTNNFFPEELNLCAYFCGNNSKREYDNVLLQYYYFIFWTILPSEGLEKNLKPILGNKVAILLKLKLKQG